MFSVYFIYMRCFIRLLIITHFNVQEYDSFPTTWITKHLQHHSISSYSLKKIVAIWQCVITCNDGDWALLSAGAAMCDYTMVVLFHYDLSIMADIETQLAKL